MSVEPLFQTHLVLGYVAWLLCFGAYILPWLKSMDRIDAHRAIATLHSFRFFGLVFVLPGVVSPALPASFKQLCGLMVISRPGCLAMLALLDDQCSVRPAFWLFVVVFNLVGMIDLLLDYYHAIHVGLGARAGELGAAYAIPILYVPLLMITHIYAAYLLVRSALQSARSGSVTRRPCARRSRPRRPAHACGGRHRKTARGSCRRAGRRPLPRTSTRRWSRLRTADRRSARAAPAMVRCRDRRRRGRQRAPASTVLR